MQFGLVAARPRAADPGSRDLVPAGRAALANRAGVRGAARRRRSATSPGAPPRRRATSTSRSRRSRRRTGELVGAGITFTDVSRYRRLQVALQEAKRDAETAGEELQATVEELETTNEELQATNEELETTNEELQATNEELETTNEELESTNEELETMNDELHQRGIELNTTNAFLEAILASLPAAIVVDRELRVQAWNDGARELWGLTPTRSSASTS